MYVLVLDLHTHVVKYNIYTHTPTSTLIKHIRSRSMDMEYSQHTVRYGTTYFGLFLNI